MSKLKEAVSRRPRAAAAVAGLLAVAVVLAVVLPLALGGDEKKTAAERTAEPKNEAPKQRAQNDRDEERDRPRPTPDDTKPAEPKPEPKPEPEQASSGGGDKRDRGSDKFQTSDLVPNARQEDVEASDEAGLEIFGGGQEDGKVSREAVQALGGEK